LDPRQAGHGRQVVPTGLDAQYRTERRPFCSEDLDSKLLKLCRRLLSVVIKDEHLQKAFGRQFTVSERYG